MTQSGKSYLWALVVWPLFLVVAVSLGAMREGIIVPALGEQAAHVIGTLIFVAVMLIIMWFFVARIRGQVSPKDLWLIGLVWMVMTVSFEFGFFHFVMGVSWEKLLADYNILAGRLWILVLLTILFGPAIMGAWQRAKPRPDE